MTIDITLFNDHWYESRLSQETSSTCDDTSSDAREIGRSLRFAGCVIAQAIDHLADVHKETAGQRISEAIQDVLTSPNVSDSNGEIANIVDATANLANALWKIAES